MDRSGGGFGGRRGGAGTSPLFLEVTLHRLYIISLNHVARVDKPIHLIIIVIWMIVSDCLFANSDVKQ